MQLRSAPTRRRGLRIALVLLLVLVIAGYVLAAELTRDNWADIGPRVRTEAVFTAIAGEQPPDLDAAGEILRARVAAAGAIDPTVTVDGATLRVSAAGLTDAELTGLGRIGDLRLRPVIHAMASQRSTPITETVAPTPVPPDFDQRLADEQQLRQSTDESIQLLALQFQATRCDGDDVLAGRDDPALPLVTCSADGTTVYLLDEAVLGSGQIRSADPQDDDVVVQFDDAGTTAWSEFTAANDGTQAAVVLDSRVLDAPEITGTEDDVRFPVRIPGQTAASVAAMLSGGALPFPLVMGSADTVSVPPRIITPARVLVAAGGVVLALITAGVLIVLLRRRV